MTAQYVGCCGYSEARARYYEQFPVVELQDTFYQPPSPALAAKWRAEAPAAFRFCMKAWQLITHTPASRTYRRLKHPVSATEHDLYGSFRPTEQVWLAWERTRDLARILRAEIVLFQLPASFTPTREHLRDMREFFGRIDRTDSWQLAFEPRGPRWPRELAEDICQELGLLYCVDPFVSGPVFAETSYWRMHGGADYQARYSDEQFDQLAGWSRDVPGSSYLMFNNILRREDARKFQQRAGLVEKEIDH